jgi:hypothetical protein
MYKRSKTPPRKIKKNNKRCDSFIILILWYIGLILCSQYSEYNFKNTIFYVIFTSLLLIFFGIKYN